MIELINNLIKKNIFDVLGTQPSDFRPQDPAIGRSGRVESEFAVKNIQFLQLELKK